LIQELIYQTNDYYPFGTPFGNNQSDVSFQKYKYNGKELDMMHGLNTYDYGARQMDPVICQWTTVDPLAEKYYNVSPYAYCADNPVNAIDPNGKEIRPTGIEELTMIKNTLPRDSWSYVQLNKDGLIDKNLLNTYTGNSLNYTNLKTLVNSNLIVDVHLDDHYQYVDQNNILSSEKMSYIPFDPKYDLESDKDINGETINGLSSGESGDMGETLFPDKDGKQNSPNNDVVVVINKKLSKVGAAEVYSHEANGHVLLYILNGENHYGASHHPIDGS
jgi:RHS repeat-associated protein